ncbi:MAG: hypothetical protein R3Y22_06080 [Bacteroidales bacterium]
MEANYVAPQIEVIELEIEGAVLQASGGGSTPESNRTSLRTVSDGGSAW